MSSRFKRFLLSRQLPNTLLLVVVVVSPLWRPPPPPQRPLLPYGPAPTHPPTPTPQVPLLGHLHLLDVAEPLWGTSSASTFDSVDIKHYAYCIYTWGRRWGCGVGGWGGACGDDQRLWGDLGRHRHAWWRVLGQVQRVHQSQRRSRTVTPFGPAVRCSAGKRKDLGSIPLRFSFLFKKGCGLWTLSCDVVTHN